MKNLLRKFLYLLGYRVHKLKKHEINLATEDVLNKDLKELQIIGPSQSYKDNHLGNFFINNERIDLHKWHHYFDIYDQQFSKFRGKTDLAVLEIGVSLGGSLRMWKDYFSPTAKIVGLDINADCKKFEVQEQNIFVEIGDQRDSEFLRSVIESHGPFDIIIDDGGHLTSQQIGTFNSLYRDGLNQGGIYLVEDTCTNYWPSFRDTNTSFIDFAKNLTDRLNEPYFVENCESLYRVGSENQISELEVSYLCAYTRSISFFESIIVFEKTKMGVPVCEIR